MSDALKVISSCLVFALLPSNVGHAGEPLPADSIYRLASTWTRQDGTLVHLDSFAGHPRLIAMIYTSCRYTCPMTVAALRRIERALPESERAGVSFILVSFDAVHDTPAELARFASAQKLDPARWTLLHGEEPSVRELATVLGVHYKKLPNGDFTHDNALLLLDASGVIRARSADLENIDEIVKAVSSIHGL